MWIEHNHRRDTDQNFSPKSIWISVPQEPLDSKYMSLYVIQCGDNLLVVQIYIYTYICVCVTILFLLCTSSFFIFFFRILSTPVFGSSKYIYPIEFYFAYWFSIFSLILFSILTSPTH